MATTAIERTITNLQTAAEQASARLAELDAVPLTERVRLTYSEGGKQYSWSEFRAALLQQIKDYGEAVASLKKGEATAAGPFTIHQML